MVRDVNAAADAGEVRAANVPRLLEVLRQFDEIFAVLKDDDAAKVRATVEWAKQEGLEDKISAATAELARAAALSDADVERLVAEHSHARKARDFARSDAESGQNWPHRAFCWRTPKTVCAGGGSKRSAGIPQKSNACSLLTVALLLRLAMNDAQGQSCSGGMQRRKPPDLCSPESQLMPVPTCRAGNSNQGGTE